MARGKTRSGAAGSTSAATVGYEAQLWQMADALRNNMLSEAVHGKRSSVSFNGMATSRQA